MKLVFILLLLSGSMAYSTGEKPVRERINIDHDWRFALGHSFDAGEDFNSGTGYFSYYTKAGYGDGPADPFFEDRTWRKVNLPHDWCMELPFDSRGGHSHGYRAIGRSFPENSTGWYRKTFFIPEEDLGRRISVDFDGVHRDSKVWVNGFYLGEHHSGYYSFSYDITEYLNYGGNNVVTVRADATMEEGWYYEGAGIYRHAWLTKTDPLHVQRYGTFVTAELTDGKAILTIRTEVVNENNHSPEYVVEHAVLNAEGDTLAVAATPARLTCAGDEEKIITKLTLENPILWSVETPYLHRLVTLIRSQNKVTDLYETIFGIRTLRFDADSGFFLNGRHVLLKGTNNHHDHAGVGVAVPDALQEYRIRKLKEMGSNAIRCSHNPPAPEFLDACDRLGMLVIDENRLMGINDEHLSMLSQMMLRDRNHPSVILWSLGNEEWAIESNIKGARITSTMQNYASRLDTTRPVTVAVSGGWDNGSGSVVQVMGYNYLVQGNMDEHHAKFPWQPGLGTEETNTMGTRGIYKTDMAAGFLAPQNRMPENVGTEYGWNYYLARPYLAGIFYWTGFDHQGEPNPCSWPAVGAQKGLLDQCGFPKDISFFLKSWWGTEPVVHIMPHWNWQGEEGKNKTVTVYSNCEEVELSLNGRNLGRKVMEKNSHLEWDIAYKPGKLTAKGFIKNRVAAEEKRETSTGAARLTLAPDRIVIAADRQDVTVVNVIIGDNDGRFVPDAMNEAFFTVKGPGEIIGVGNGNPASHEPDQYFETVTVAQIERLKIMVVEDTISRAEKSEGFDSSGWAEAFPEGKWDTLISNPSVKAVIIRGEFFLPDITEAAAIALYARSLGEVQSIYINGHKVTQSMVRSRESQEFNLTKEIVRSGRNEYAIAGTPLLRQNPWDELNTYAGAVKVVYPASQWRRRAFNGLAQLIIRSTGGKGIITLTAESEGLIPAEVSISSE